MTEKTFLIKDRVVLKVISDPLRAQVLETLVTEPLTVKQVADKLGLAPSKLYYHVNMLEKHGLLRVVETRTVANMLEKVYQATACDLRVAPHLLMMTSDEGKDSILSMAISTLETTREDILRSLQARFHQLEQGAQQHPRQVMITREVTRIPDELAEEFCKRMGALIEEFCSAEVPPSTPDAMRYAVTVAVYPSFYYDDETDAKDNHPGQ